jgi:hypothetical protein
MSGRDSIRYGYKMEGVKYKMDHVEWKDKVRLRTVTHFG